MANNHSSVGANSLNMPGLTSFQIKLLAAGFMVIDHIGRLFWPEQIALQAIGRLSFPLFAWLAAQGEAYTSNLRNYILRLLGVGLITQPIYLCFLSQIQGKPFDWNPLTWELLQWNMLFALAYGVGMIRWAKQQSDLVIRLAIVLLMASIAQWLKLEGGMITLASIYAMSLLSTSPIVGYACFIALYLLYLTNANGWIELFAVFAPLIALLHNGEQGSTAKWFYSFYPLHFAVLIGIKLYVLPNWWPRLTTILQPLMPS